MPVSGLAFDVLAGEPEHQYRARDYRQVLWHAVAVVVATQTQNCRNGNERNEPEQDEEFAAAVTAAKTFAQAQVLFITHVDTHER